MIKKFFKKITGIEKIELERQKALDLAREAEDAQRAAELAQKEAEETKRIASLTPKELATEREEPWVDVLNIHANKENISHGFFELDWNSFFIVKLRNEGYGSEGDPDEEIVDRWFRQVCYNVGVENGVNMYDRGAGYIDIKKLPNNRSEIS